MAATCVITVLKPEFGWDRVEKQWVYDPTYKRTDLDSIWRDNLPACIRYDSDNLKSSLCNPAIHPPTAYVGLDAQRLRDQLDELEWPKDNTEFVSRFDLASQYMIGPSFGSGYHLGDGYVATAGHVLDKALTGDRLGELRVVFNWVGDVKHKKIFTDEEVWGVERVVLCDTNGPAPEATDKIGIAMWAGRWDCAVFKLRGGECGFEEIGSTKYAMEPSRFGSMVYGIGASLGTQLKVSAGGRVLRHCLVDDEGNPFSHRVDGRGTFSTDLDQFEGRYVSLFVVPHRVLTS